MTLRYKKNLKYTNDEYDHFLCFLATESESDIRSALSHLDLAALELWIEKGKKLSVSDLQL